MLSSDRVVDAIKHYIDEQIRAQTTQYVYGEYLGAETVDANLSRVKVGTIEYRFVPKVAGVTPSAGDTVIVGAGGGMIQTIIGIHSGDITLANLVD